MRLHVAGAHAGVPRDESQTVHEVEVLVLSVQRQLKCLDVVLTVDWREHLVFTVPEESSVVLN